MHILACEQYCTISYSGANLSRRRDRSPMDPSNSPLRPSKAGAVLMAKDDDDGQTVLMIAAATGNVAVFDLVVSQLPREQVGELGPGVLQNLVYSPRLPLVECWNTAGQENDRSWKLRLGPVLPHSRKCRHGTKTPTPPRRVCSYCSNPVKARFHHSPFPHLSQTLKLLKERCVRGNLVLAYAAKTGKAAMVEAVLAQYPPDGVSGQYIWRAVIGVCIIVDDNLEVLAHLCQSSQRLWESERNNVTVATCVSFVFGGALLQAMHVEDALCAHNFNGETSLLLSAGAADPGAFHVVAKTLSAGQVRSVAKTPPQRHSARHATNCKPAPGLCLLRVFLVLGKSSPFLFLRHSCERMVFGCHSPSLFW